MPLFWRDGAWHEDDGPALTGAEATALRDAFLDGAAAELAALAGDLADAPRAAAEFAPATVAAWAAAFGRRLAELVTDAYVFARGGLAAMADPDWEAVAGAIDRAAGYAAGFADAVRAGDLSREGVANRAALYGHDLAGVWERGRAAQLDGLDLPAYPGEGVACGPRCRCWWDVAERPDRWEATWVAAGDRKTCADCEQRAGEWAPFLARKRA
jgi:hypothetical protein